MQSYQDEAEEFLAKLFKDFNELQKDYNKLSPEAKYNVDRKMADYIKTQALLDSLNMLVKRFNP